AVAASAVFLLILVVSVVIWVIDARNHKDDSDGSDRSSVVTVANFVGKRIEDIRASDYPDLILELDNYEEVYNDEYEAGCIIKQEPEAYAQVKRDRTVRFTVSKGKNESLMPDFVDSLGTDAQLTLQALNMGLKITMEEIGSEDITKGYIVRTEPVAGEKLEKNQSVTLYISLGSNRMPRLEGESKEDAEVRLNNMDLNLKVSFIEQADDTVPKGYIIRTEPAADSHLEKGQRITVYVSLGSDKMPDLIGESKNNAEVLLKAMDMDLRISLDLLEDSDTVPEGDVCRTEPEAGTTLVKGQHIKVYISTGSKYVTVPDVLNMTEAEARTILEEAGLQCVVGEPAYYEGFDVGRVGGMSVKPESKIEKGETIIIYLSIEPEEVTESTEPPTEPPTETEPTEPTTEPTEEGANG
ncbi:MAG: PASTA domain-containing protein, partial [Oscillospiraceae bacterium]|nr:PASTA domain-containing protein [Oscillospiraceae bacterium]